ncbi:MAG: efflux RND transporter permease subunit [Bacteroidales bacterium]|nr:efflux RND transporter permease subunit [Bacteroidales bacterium]
MIRFLLQRPVAVFMSFLAVFIIGAVTYFTLPVSLLPDIPIPEITVQVSGEGQSARELENTQVQPLMRQLMQVGRLRGLHSETRDGSALIRMSFEYGVQTDLAFIEVNEKIDAAMNLLSRETDRPRVVKASANDIPVLYLNLTLKTDSALNTAVDTKFLDLCEFAETVIKRQIEQLPEVAMVDITGLMKKEIRIITDPVKLESIGITLNDLETSLKANHVDLGSMMVRDGYYEYNIKFPTLLRTAEDIENIYIHQGDHIFQLKDLAKVEIAAQTDQGLALSEGKRAITLAVIKQADENMSRLKKTLAETIASFETRYPDVEFSTTRNQTELLDYTMSNLQQNLSMGLLFILIVAVLFLGDIKSPVIIGLSLIVAIVTAFLFFYLFDMSLNIISLAGLALASGMMIDSAIVVTENITQYREKGYDLEEACVIGTNEVISPMLSSSLTTIAVFVPLIFMSGIAGAIFYDQAFAVTVGLFTSYCTGIFLLPVLYKLVYGRKHSGKSAVQPIKVRSSKSFIYVVYNAGYHFTFRHKWLHIIGMTLSIPLCVYLFQWIDKERMPHIDYQETVVKIDWNENIHVGENHARIVAMLQDLNLKEVQHDAYVGQQQFLLNSGDILSGSESILFFKTSTTKTLTFLQESINQWIGKYYPLAVLAFSPPETVFEKIFNTGESKLVAELYTNSSDKIIPSDVLRRLQKEMAEAAGMTPQGISFEDQLNLNIDRERLLLYGISFSEVQRALKAAFHKNEVATLRSYQQQMPISMVHEDLPIETILRKTFINTEPDKDGKVYAIPLALLMKSSFSEELKIITGGINGEFISFAFPEVDNIPEVMPKIREIVSRENDQWALDFSGSYFSNQKMIKEIIIILFISILLMYFILTAQFESFLQPLIVLAEIPIDLAAAIILLKICGHTLNLMSAIGMVVVCGIIINDSILKLDVMNELRKAGYPLKEAIHEAGLRRLRPIIMTSLTTVFAMVPLLFTKDIGSTLQQPLSLAIIGSMAIGTWVSLFIIPLFYWLIYRKHDQTPAES